MLRGVTIVERLLNRKLIDGGTRELVVSGAGAGGASVAMAAARLGVRTTLVEAAAAPFVTQSFSLSRQIDPTQYDWPLDHYSQRRFPWDVRHPPFPLPFRAARARQLALVWRSELQRYAASYPLTVLTGRTIRTASLLQIAATPDPIRCLEVTLDDGSLIQAGAWVDAKGFGRERCTVPNALPFSYEGAPFWGPDTFDRLDPERHTVLISGSGDGALQDYLRVITHLPTASDIVARCNLPPDIIHAVQSAEDRSLRGRSWASDDGSSRSIEEDPYFLELEFEHRRAVGRALSYPRVRAGLAGVVPADPVKTHVVYKEPYISAYYGLNRFLVLLISAYIEQQPNGWQSLFPGTTIASIADAPSDPHDCIDLGTGRANGTYDPTHTVLLAHECFEKLHTVTFNGGASPGSPMAYNVIIVRHGLEQAPRLTLKRTRHLLPYHRA